MNICHGSVSNFSTLFCITSRPAQSVEAQGSWDQGCRLKLSQVTLGKQTPCNGQKPPRYFCLGNWLMSITRGTSQQCDVNSEQPLHQRKTRSEAVGRLDHINRKPWFASLVAQMVKRLPAARETQVQSLGWEDPLGKEMATHSSTLAWKIPRTEKPGRLQSTGLRRVGHDWATSLSLSKEPGGTSDKEPTYQRRRLKSRGFHPWVRKIPWRRAWLPTPVLLPGEFHGQRSLVGYSPWCCKDSDMTEAT